MVERTDQPAIATFFSPDPFTAGAPLTLGEDVAHHARVTRLGPGARVGLRDGAGGIGAGVITRISKTMVTVDVSEFHVVPRGPAIHLLPPVADRERMLWLGEKATEFGVASWRPVMWKRSKSVSPRGEGPTFQSKLKARMVSALIQSGGAWLPDIFPEATVEAAVAATPAGARFILDREADTDASSNLKAPVAVAVGPEGGIERAEMDAFVDGNFSRLRLAPSTLRFETAGVAGIAVIMSRLSPTGSTNG